MCFRRFIRLLFVLLFLLAFSGKDMLCLGQEPDYRDSTRWTIELPLWVPGFKGAVSFGEITIDGGNENGNGGGGILEKIFDSKYGLDYYLVGKVSYLLNKWRFQADVFGGQIEHSTIFTYNGETLSNTKIRVLMPRIMVAYRVLAYDCKREHAGSLQAYVYSGLKVFNAGVKATLPNPIPPLDFTTKWTEFLLGASVYYYWRNFTLGIKADTAPFKLFENSSWWYQCHARYRFGKRISAQLGWVRQDFTRIHELQGEDLAINFTLQGPLAGIAIHF